MSIQAGVLQAVNQKRHSGHRQHLPLSPGLRPQCPPCSTAWEEGKRTVCICLPAGPHREGARPGSWPSAWHRLSSYSEPNLPLALEMLEVVPPVPQPQSTGVINITVTSHADSRCPGVTWRAARLSVTAPLNSKPPSNHNRTSHKPRLGGQSNVPGDPGQHSAILPKTREKQGTPEKPSEARADGATGGLHAMWDPGTQRGHSWAMGGHLDKAGSSVNSTPDVTFSVFTTVCWSWGP